MFHVDRYNPETTAVDGNQTDTKEENNKETKEPSKTSSIRVIAEEQPEPKRRKVGVVHEESIDDLINDEVPDADEKEPFEKKNENLNSSQLTEEEVQVALRIAQKPMLQVARAWKLAPFLIENLQSEGFERFFPIQALTIPDVITTERNPHIQVRDVCVAAPTGNGKTLAYVLPLLHSLSQRSGGPRRMRALVVLPSRELAMQVYQVVQRYLIGSPTLKVGIATGQSPMVAEQKSLTIDDSSWDPAMIHTHLTSYDPGNVKLALQMFHHDSQRTTIPMGGWSNVDVLVCTPGRLVDHLDNTPGFSLQHLRFLVVDEADRLLGRSYNNWVDRIREATSTTPQPNPSFVDPVTWRQGPSAVQLRKFLVSATLTRDPQKLASMRLLNPKHFDVHLFHDQANKYTMPDTLAEYVVECTAAQKPIVLLSLLREKATVDHKVIVFTSRLDSTHRLTRLLQLVWVSLGREERCIGEFSGALNRKERSDFLERCGNPNDDLSVIVCSDAMSRGMDIRVGTAINYDIPILAKTYVHRCGRTARATRKGEAVSLVKGGQMAQFRRMRGLIREPNRVETMVLQKESLKDLIDVYQGSVGALRKVVDAEACGDLSSRGSIRTFSVRHDKQAL